MGGKWEGEVAAVQCMQWKEENYLVCTRMRNRTWSVSLLKEVEQYYILKAELMGFLAIGTSTQLRLEVRQR